VTDWLRPDPAGSATARPAPGPHERFHAEPRRRPCWPADRSDLPGPGSA